jgi:hypothetical protein
MITKVTATFNTSLKCEIGISECRNERQEDIKMTRGSAFVAPQNSNGRLSKVGRQLDSK